MKDTRFNDQPFLSAFFSVGNEQIVDIITFIHIYTTCIYMNIILESI